jgi:hypothetical protein
VAGEAYREAVVLVGGNPAAQDHRLTTRGGNGVFRHSLRGGAKVVTAETIRRRLSALGFLLPIAS